MNLLSKFYNKEIEFYGDKDIYVYFNLINEKFENKIFASSDLEGSILSTEPLVYKIRSNIFPNNSHQIPNFWKTNIRVVLQKKGTGTQFNIYPITGAYNWIICSILLIIIVVKLINGPLFTQPSEIFGPIICITILYLLDNFAKRSLISDFKEQILYK
jgi:hypothetical protein